jgi:hypothetical protein
MEAKSLADIRESQVRRWRKERLDAGVSEVTVAKAYRTTGPSGTEVARHREQDP